MIGEVTYFNMEENWGEIKSNGNKFRFGIAEVENFIYPSIGQIVEFNVSSFKMDKNISFANNVSFIRHQEVING